MKRTLNKKETDNDIWLFLILATFITMMLAIGSLAEQYLDKIN